MVLIFINSKIIELLKKISIEKYPNAILVIPGEKNCIIINKFDEKYKSTVIPPTPGAVAAKNMELIKELKKPENKNKCILEKDFLTGYQVLKRNIEYQTFDIDKLDDISVFAAYIHKDIDINVIEKKIIFFYKKNQVCYKKLNDIDTMKKLIEILESDINEKVQKVQKRRVGRILY